MKELYQQRNPIVNLILDWIEPMPLQIGVTMEREDGSRRHKRFTGDQAREVLDQYFRSVDRAEAVA